MHPYEGFMLFLKENFELFLTHVAFVWFQNCVNWQYYIYVIKEKKLGIFDYGL